ncbi:hypothetical protein SAMN05192549_11110 [Duganella sacchari]|uniref:Lipoprotein n=1 Tax=Duganella sacchari TaxID=551987 RepID=A0A1M7R5S1_9BURK|nr:hypothetical protein [Duganella sacchari]SHN40543.1 hypothetical protein SAMN05192549_11110 [Duganella sacchari]
MPKNFNLIGLVFISALLSACSSKPTDDDLRQAQTKSYQKMTGSLSEQDKKDIAEMRVLSCTKLEDKSYDCSIQGILGPQKVQMIKGDDGWTVVN